MTDDELLGVDRLLAALDEAASGELEELVDEVELVRLRHRCQRLRSTAVFPVPRGDWPAIPWPPF